MTRYISPPHGHDETFEVARVARNTMDCDGDEIPSVGITRSQYVECGGVPLVLGRRAAEAEFLQRIQHDAEARTAIKGLLAQVATLPNRL